MLLPPETRVKGLTWMLLLLLGSAGRAQPQVPRVVYDNPIAGFSLEIPEDWEMATAAGKNIEIALDASVGAALTSQPALWFFYVAGSPEEEARRLAQSLQAVGGGAVPQIRETGRPEEWEVTSTSNGTRGPLVERWLCRRERGRTYLIGAMVRPDFAAPFQDDLETALRTCHLIDRPTLQSFREPTENAYRLLLPPGWKWEGQILRTELVPGYFTWKVQSPDGLTGCFSSPPGVFNVMTPYIPAPEAAQELVLPGLQEQVPGVRLERVHPLPRVGDYFCASIRGAGLGDHPRVDKVRADYVGTAQGTPVRIRVDIVTVMLEASPLLGGRGNWFLMASGQWAPLDQFDLLYPAARGVLSSLWTSRQWKKAQREAVKSVLGKRGGVLEEVSEAWDQFIRE